VLASANAWLAVALLPFCYAVGLSPVMMRKRVDKMGSQAARRRANSTHSRSIGAGPA